MKKVDVKQRRGSKALSFMLPHNIAMHTLGGLGLILCPHQKECVHKFGAADLGP